MGTAGRSGRGGALGRDAQILRGLDVLRGMRTSGVESLFVILGPSGAGKSSFLRAGLLPGCAVMTAASCRCPSCVPNAPCSPANSASPTQSKSCARAKRPASADAG